jgi:hypothetical protein
MRRCTVMIAFMLCLAAAAPGGAAMYVIENPAGKISNPADKMYNPATQSNNPASNIYNPGTRLDERNPLSPPTPPAQKATATAQDPPVVARPTQTGRQGQTQTQVSRKKYYYRTVGAYLRAAKKAFTEDNFVEFVAITEDALARINAGNLKASANVRHRLNQYQTFGYGMLQ